MTHPSSATLAASRPVTSQEPRQPLRYHRLARTCPGWWWPPATLGLATLLYGAFFLSIVAVLLVIGLASPRAEQVIDAALFADDDMGNPLTLAGTLALIALFLPACRLAVRLSGRPGALDSVAHRFRWGLCLRAAGVSAAVVGGGVLACTALLPEAGRRAEHVWWTTAIILLLVPFQAAGEEYVFRGLLPQVLGARLRSPVWGAVVSLPLFVWGHEYRAWGLVATGVFAGAAAYLVWRTGGLEVVVAWHAVNNVLAFGLVAWGVSDPAHMDLPVSVALDIATTVTLTVVLEQLWRHRWSQVHAAEAVLRLGR